MGSKHSKVARETVEKVVTKHDESTINGRAKHDSHASASSGSSTSMSSNSGSISNLPDTSKVTLSDFDILSVIGKGSYGKVFLVREKDSGVHFALKEMNKREVVFRGHCEHALNELDVHIRMYNCAYQCPYIVPLRWAFHTAARLYMVFDVCTGGELYFHLGKRGKVPLVLARFYAAEITVALEHLHSLGVIYHDLKPENLVLDAEGHVNLIDFGLCKTQGMQKRDKVRV